MSARRLFLGVSLGVLLSIGLIRPYSGAAAPFYQRDEVSPAACKSSAAKALRVKAEDLPTSRIYFVQNRGQYADAVLAHARTHAYDIALVGGAFIFNLRPLKGGAAEMVRLDLLGADAHAAFELAEPQAPRLSFFRGSDPAGWQKGLGTFAAARYRGIYPGVDLRVYGRAGRIEYDFVVAPGADPGRIAFRYAKQGPARISDAGDIELKLGHGDFVQRRPEVYQLIEGRKARVEGGFAGGPDGSYRFALGAYDKSRTLVIDPAVELKYSTYLGGTGSDLITGIDLDSSGAIYVTGVTSSADFPLGQSHNGALAGGNDVFVSKFSANGQSLIYTTYIGGKQVPATSTASPDEGVAAIKVNAAGQAIIAGSTRSSDFPVVNGYAAYGDESFYDSYVARLSADGTDLLYSTCIGTRGQGGTGHLGDDAATDLALDEDGLAYVVGYTNRGYGAPFPTKNAYRHCVIPNASLPYLAKFDTTKSGEASLVFSTCYGENRADEDSQGSFGYGIALDAAKNIYIVGSAASADFPTKNAYDTDCGHGFWGGHHSRGFLAKFDADAQNLLYGTCFGGPGSDQYEEAHGVAVNADGVAYVVGATQEEAFPVKDPFYYPGAAENYRRGYLTLFDTTASGEESLVKSTTFGGGGAWDLYSMPLSVALDASSNIYLAGFTLSSFLPVINAYQDTLKQRDCFVMKITPDAAWPLYSTYLGGWGDDYCTGIAVDAQGSAFVAGYTNRNASVGADYPLQDPLQESYGGGDWDGFVTKLSQAGAESLQVVALGPRSTSPGGSVSYVLRYKNNTAAAAKDVILRAELPKPSRFMAGTTGAIYRAGRHEVFWQLGDLAAGAQGEVTLTVEYRWGLAPHTMTILSAVIDATNLAEHPLSDLGGYQAYTPIEIVSRRDLSAAEADALLAGNAELKQLYQDAGKEGFANYGAAEEILWDNGSNGAVFTLLKRSPAEVIYLKLLDGQVHGERVSIGAGGYSVFDGTGGFSYDYFTQSDGGWGAWNEPAAGALTRADSPCASKRNACMYNCLTQNYNFMPWTTPDIWCAQQKHTASSCVQCLLRNDDSQCDACKVHVAECTDYSLEVLGCFDACQDNPGSYNCTADRAECGYFTGDWFSTCEAQEERVQVCDPNTCKLRASVTNCCGGACPSCSGDRCSQASAAARAAAPQARGSIPGAEQVCVPTEIIVAGDPNAKYGFEGDVIPGQKLDYTIEYENVGSGAAYGVFVIDELDADLDESTLVIEDGGSYSAASRSITWEIGALDPKDGSHDGGTVHFSVKVKSGLASGAEIVNQATVYFPSVPETTPTNPVVNRVFAITAQPQDLETASGKALSITLSGKDSGDADLSFEVTAPPEHGTLTGQAPHLVYHPQDQFNGRDQFSFISGNGQAESRPAQVAIVVTPGGEKIAPTVLYTYPAANAGEVPVLTVAGEDGSFGPVIMARFSEPINPDTLTGASFFVSGVAGTASYDVLTQTAYFKPAAPLAHETVYTAALSTGIQDNSGNALAESFTWQFTTVSAVDIKVTLPPPDTEGLEFERQALGSASDAKTVTVFSAGTEELVLGQLELTGAGAGDFSPAGDTCSGETLSPGESCTVRVIFEPKSGGGKSAVLAIPSNDEGENPYRVQLGGAAASFGVTPTAGTVGTLLSISGTGFGAKKGKAKLGAKALKVKRWSNKRISAVLTKALKPGSYDLMLKPKGGKKISPMVEQGAFEVKAPEIISVAPRKGRAYTLRGRFLGTKRGKVFAECGAKAAKQCKLSAWPKNSRTGTDEGQVKFSVPAAFAGEGCRVRVVNGVGADTAELGVVP